MSLDAKSTAQRSGELSNVYEFQKLDFADGLQSAHQNRNLDLLSAAKNYPLFETSGPADFN